MMKQFIGTKLVKAAVLGLALVSGQVSAGLFDSVMTSGWDTVKSKPYSLGVYGFDARAFEWTPMDNPNVRCVFVASNKSSGVACYDVEESLRIEK